MCQDKIVSNVRLFAMTPRHDFDHSILQQLEIFEGLVETGRSAREETLEIKEEQTNLILMKGWIGE